MKHEALQEALKRRKGNGVDITLIIGKPEEEEKKETELAPEVKDASSADVETAKEHTTMDQSLMGPPGMKQETPHGDESQDRKLIEQMMAGHEAQEGEEPDMSTIKGKVRAGVLKKHAAMKK